MLEVSRVLPAAIKSVALGSLAIAFITAACFSAHLSFEIPSLLYLMVVVFQSLLAGYASSAAVSVVAAACLEYFFIPPVLEWQINDPEDALALFAYLVTSLVITRLASKARNETRKAESKRKDAALLYETASRLLTLEPAIAAGTRALRIFREVFGLNAACLFDAGTTAVLVDGEPEHGLARETRNAYVLGHDYRNSDGWVHVHCIRVGGKPVGAVGFEGRFEDESAVFPLFALADTAFERARSFRSAGKAAAAVQAEMLRSAILDAFAHEFKTPQAVIMTAAGSLRQTGGLRTEQLEMADVIENEICRLNHLTTGLLRMARLDRDDVKPRMEVTDLGELVTHLIGQYRSHCGDHLISIKLQREAPDVLTDPELMNLALVQLLDNACKYSDPGSSVAIELDRDEEFANVFVTNGGRPIRREEEERIFERSYRGVETEHVTSGTGLGLYVARKIVRAHGGNLELDQNHAKHGSTTFRVRLPIVQREPPHERRTP